MDVQGRRELHGAGGQLPNSVDTGGVNGTKGLEKGFANEIRLVASRAHFLWRREETIF